MLIQGQVGAPAGSNTPGSTPAIRQGQLGDLVVSELHGRYYETTYRRNVFVANSPLATASSGLIALGSAYTGLALFNPLASSVNLVINKVGFGFTVAPTATLYGIATGVTTQTPGSTTLATTRNAFVNGQNAQGQGIAYSVATFGTAANTGGTTPVVHTIVGAQAASVGGAYYDLEGSLILPPGAYLEFYLSASSGATGTAYSVQWEEVPV